MSRNGKPAFFKYLLDEEMITEDEYYFLLWYNKYVKEELEKEVK